MVSAVAAQLPPATCAALDALIQTEPDEHEEYQAPLFPVRSELASLKEEAGAIKVETVREEMEKPRQLRALGLPEHLFRDVPAKLVTHYRQRAASEKPRELRRHPPTTRSMLPAALCRQRAREITDTLVDLLLHIAHAVCSYSQLKSCSSSEFAAMIEGVLRHDTAMDVDRNYVDTHGQSEEVIETWNSANDFILYGKSGEFASNKTEDHEILMLSLHLLQVSLV